MQKHMKNDCGYLGIYHIEPKQFEYAEYIGETEFCDIQRVEKLFQLSSDDSLVLVYPQIVPK